MSIHHHLKADDICDRVIALEGARGVDGCSQCEAEVASFSRSLDELKRADAALKPMTEWDDLLLRRRIREALAKEKPHSRSVFDRFALLRPAFVSALIATIALSAWSPGSRFSDPGSADVAPQTSTLLPAWSPLPDESEDEGLALLAAWTPSEDEVAIAQCRAACLSGLSRHEEENLFRSVSVSAPRPPTTLGSPL